MLIPIQRDEHPQLEPIEPVIIAAPVTIGH